MKDHIVSRKTMARLCAEPSPDDGLDPHSRSRIMPGDRHLHCRSQEGPDRKALQLCHQVAETLEEVLAECGDVVLQALRVLDVEPAPDASRLLVTVAVDATPKAVLDPCSVHDHLVRAVRPPPQRGGRCHHTQACAGAGLPSGGKPGRLLLLTAIRRAGVRFASPGSHWLRFNRPSRVRAGLRYWALRS